MVKLLTDLWALTVTPYPHSFGISSRQKLDLRSSPRYNKIMAAPTPEQIAYMMAHDHEDRRPNFVIANSICIGLAVTAVGLRFLARGLARIKFALDDWTILLALVAQIVFTAAMLSLVQYGMGRHVLHMTNIKKFSIVSL
jgi:hypothetical protein